MGIYIKEDIEKVLKAEREVEVEIRQDGNTPDDFTEKEWVEMIIEKIQGDVKI